MGRLDDIGPALPRRAHVPRPRDVGRIETEVERNGKIGHDTVYLSSIALCALTFARAVFREDLARFRTGDDPQNMAIIRHTTLNLLSRAEPSTSLKNRRKRAG